MDFWISCLLPGTPSLQLESRIREIYLRKLVENYSGKRKKVKWFAYSCILRTIGEKYLYWCLEWSRKFWLPILDHWAFVLSSGTTWTIFLVILSPAPLICLRGEASKFQLINEFMLWIHLHSFRHEPWRC